MNYGLYVAASGMMVNLYRQDVIANNLANLQTTGFKPEVVTFQQRDPERIEDRIGTAPAKAMLERLGGGVLLGPSRVDFSQGTIRETHRPMDLAVDGEGFFELERPNGEAGDRIRFTRDGRFVLDDAGFMVHAASGDRLLDDRGRPIRLARDGSGVTFDGDGTVRQDGAEVARVGLSGMNQEGSLRPVGKNEFAAADGDSAGRQEASGRIVQGSVEESGVDPMAALMEMTSAGNAVAANARMIQFHDDLTGFAINRFARLT